MVGYEKGDNVGVLDSSKAGIMGGIVTRVIISPVDVLKIRFQLQAHKDCDIGRKYTGIPQAVKLIFKEEGLRGFWKGHGPAQFLSIINGGMQFGTFQYFTETVNANYPNSHNNIYRKTATHLACGSLSGIFSNIVSHPVDTLRTRFAVQKEPKMYKTSFEAARHMAANEGYTSFFKGLTPSLIQVAPYAGMQFASYTFFLGLLKKSNFADSAVLHASCGAAAGLISKATVYPMDVIKKRLQVQGFGKATVSEVVHYRNFRHCARLILKTEGIRGFYKGWTIAALKSALTTGLVFMTYEYFVRFNRRRSNRRRNDDH